MGAILEYKCPCCGGPLQFDSDAQKMKYALYPVWLLTAKWNGEIYNFAMNGQTGKFVGNPPMDKGAYWRWTGLIALIATAISLVASAAFILLG